MHIMIDHFVYSGCSAKEMAAIFVHKEHNSEAIRWPLQGHFRRDIPEVSDLKLNKYTSLKRTGMSRPHLTKYRGKNLVSL